MSWAQARYLADNGDYGRARLDGNESPYTPGLPTDLQPSYRTLTPSTPSRGRGQAWLSCRDADRTLQRAAKAEQ